MTPRPAAKLTTPTIEMNKRFDSFCWYNKGWQDRKVSYFVWWVRKDGHDHIDPEFAAEYFRKLVKEAGLTPVEGESVLPINPPRKPIAVSATETFSRAFIHMVDNYPSWHDLSVQDAAKWLAVRCGHVDELAISALENAFRQAVASSGLEPIEDDAKAG